MLAVTQKWTERVGQNKVVFWARQYDRSGVYRRNRKQQQRQRARQAGQIQDGDEDGVPRGGKSYKYRYRLRDRIYRDPSNQMHKRDVAREPGDVRVTVGESEGETRGCGVVEEEVVVDGRRGRMLFE